MNENTIGSSCINLHSYSTIGSTPTSNCVTEYITNKDEIEKFIEELKTNINRKGDKIDLYLKTKSKIALNSCIIDANGNISLNFESNPKDMKFDWIQDKKSDSYMIYTQAWNYSCTQLHKYQEILDVLKPSEFNYYKVNVNINDVVKIDSYEVKVKKMTIVSEILPIPKISYRIHDIKENGALEVIIENKLTHKESIPFYIKPDSEEDIATAISKELDKMSIVVELGKTKGEIEISDLSKNVQDYIKTEE